MHTGISVQYDYSVLREVAMFSYSHLADLFAYFRHLFTSLLFIKGASLAELVCDLRCTGDLVSVFDIGEVNLSLYTS